MNLKNKYSFFNGFLYFLKVFSFPFKVLFLPIKYFYNEVTGNGQESPFFFFLVLFGFSLIGILFYVLAYIIEPVFSSPVKQDGIVVSTYHSPSSATSTVTMVGNVVFNNTVTIDESWSAEVILNGDNTYCLISSFDYENVDSGDSISVYFSVGHITRLPHCHSVSLM